MHSQNSIKSLADCDTQVVWEMGGKNTLKFVVYQYYTKDKVPCWFSDSVHQHLHAHPGHKEL